MFVLKALAEFCSGGSGRGVEWAARQLSVDEAKGVDETTQRHYGGSGAVSGSPVCKSRQVVR